MAEMTPMMRKYVETKEQYDYVSSLDEDVLIQGYWFSRPVCLKDIKKLLSPDS